MRKTFTLAIATMLLITAFGAGAFTTGYADRTSTIDVVADSNNALIGLEDGNTGDIVGASGDQLTIDFTNASANGANADAYFELGDNSSGNQTYAFKVTNNDGANHKLTLNYTLDTADADSSANVTFEVFDASNTHLLTASEESVGSTADGAFTSGQTVYVVVKVDTTDLATSDSLSGTLRVKLS